MIDAMVLIDQVHSVEIYKLPKNLSGAKIKICFFFFLCQENVLYFNRIN